MKKNPADATTRNIRKSNALFRKHAARLGRLEAKASHARTLDMRLLKTLRYALVDVQKLGDRLAILEARKG